jgi:hypothetical protein
MVQYSEIRGWQDNATRERTIDRLIALRAGLAKDVPLRNEDESSAISAVIDLIRLPARRSASSI